MSFVTFLQDQARNENVTVGTSSQVIILARQSQQKRKAFLIRNISTGSQVVTVNLGLSQAVNNAGIVLKPGESFSDSTETGYQAFQGTITAISDVAGASLAIMER